MNDIVSWITPFSFLSGVGLLILSTANRFHHVNNLIRSFQHHSGDTKYLENLLRRSRHFHTALTSLYISMGCFSVAALLGNLNQSWLGGAVLWVYVSDAVMTLGVACVVFSSWRLICESSLSYRMICQHEHDAENEKKPAILR